MLLNFLVYQFQRLFPALTSLVLFYRNVVSNNTLLDIATVSEPTNTTDTIWSNPPKSPYIILVRTNLLQSLFISLTSLVAADCATCGCSSFVSS